MRPKKENIQTGAIAMVLSVLLSGSYTTFLKPEYKEYQIEVQKEIKDYVKSDDYNKGFRKEKFLEYAKSDDFKAVLVSYLANAPSGQNERLLLETMLAFKWDVEEKEVAGIIDEIYKTIKSEEKDKERFKNLIKAFNQEHPEHNVYRTEE